MKEPVRSILWAHPGTMARDGFLLSFFFIPPPFLSLSLIRLHRKSELPFVCNGESRKGEGARSREGGVERGVGGGGGREGSGEWRGNKGRRREGRCRETAAHPAASPLGFSIFPLSLLCFYSLSLSFSFPPLVLSLPWPSSAPPQSIFRLPIRRSKSLEEKRRRGYAVLIIVVVFFLGDRLFSSEIICHRARAIIRYSPLLSLPC